MSFKNNLQDDEAADDVAISVSSTFSDSNISSNVKTTKSDTILESIKESTVKDIPEDNSENDAKPSNSSFQFKNEEFIKQETYETEIQAENTVKLSSPINAVSNSSDVELKPPQLNNEKQCVGKKSDNIRIETEQKRIFKDVVDDNNNNINKNRYINN